MSVKVDIQDRIARITLAHPPVNALDSAGWAQLARTIESVGKSGDANVVILGAEGRGFCAGVDIKELAADGSAITKVNKGCYDSFAAVYDCEVPVIAAVHGFVLGGGIGLSGAADIVIAADNATFGLPEIDRGALGAATHLMRMFPIQKVRRMLYTGESITAEEAWRFGAIESVVPKEKLDDEATALAQKIAAKSPKALRLAKESLNGIELLDIKKSYRYEQGFTLELYTSPDSQEARDAFVEKRDAKFEGSSEK